MFDEEYEYLEFSKRIFCEYAITFICGLRAHVCVMRRGLGVWSMEHETQNMGHGAWNIVHGFCFCIRERNCTQDI